MKKMIILFAAFLSLSSLAHADQSSEVGIKVCTVETNSEGKDGLYYVELVIVRVSDGNVVRHFELAKNLVKSQALELLNSHVCN